MIEEATELTLREAAVFLGVPVRELLGRVDRLELPAHRRAGDLVFRRADLEAAARP